MNDNISITGMNEKEQTELFIRYEEEKVNRILRDFFFYILGAISYNLIYTYLIH